mgnify:FL=1|tara:strand:+ start:7183 stop:7824 length:642 start_codon:yes stop_codon:yes gene_type:complete
MKQTVKLPSKIPVFPLSNFIIFPETTVPLNIFEPRYIQMIDDVMKHDRIIGMVQPKEENNQKPKLYNIGCAGRITSFHETEDGRYLIIINGVCRFKILNEFSTNKLYRECEVIYNDFYNDTKNQNEEIKFTDLELIFKNLKTLFNKQGYKINWKEIEKQSLDQTINTLSMASPFSLEEKQILLETVDLKERKKKLEEILKTYIFDNYSNNTVQ